MQVTPRLPVHGHYASLSSSFLELRYFRFGQTSKAIAVVFGVLELLSLPQNKVMKKRLLEQNRLCAPNSKRILEFALDGRIVPEVRLAAWNYPDFVTAVLQALGEMFSIGLNLDEAFFVRMQETVAFRAIHCREEFKDTPEIKLKLFWDTNEDGAVLLYRKRTMDSFVVVPICRHVHLKFQLFAEVKRTMRIPMNKKEMLTLGIKCGMTGCTTPITDIVIRLMEEMANPWRSVNAQEIFLYISSAVESLEKFYLRVNKYYDKCECCGGLQGNKACSAGCLICIRCAAVACFTQSHLRCPQCGERIKKNIFGMILREAAKMQMIGMAQDYIECDGCRIEKPKIEFSLNETMIHPCAICNECLGDRKVVGNECPGCGESLRAETKSYLRGEMNSQSPSSGPVKSRYCKKCKCPKHIENFGKYLATSHPCFVCDFCIEGQKTNYCVSCSSPYSDSDRSKLQLESSYAIHCFKCLNGRPLTDYQCASKLSHWWKCKICDSCFATYLHEGRNSTCLQCFQEFTTQDLCLLETHRQAILDRQIQLTAHLGIISSPRSALQESQRRQPSNIRSSDTLLCRICQFKVPFEKLSLFYDFEHECVVCDDCYTFLDYSWSWGTASECRVCKKRLPSGIQNKIFEIKRASHIQESLTCLKCKSAMQKNKMMKMTKLEHSCDICDSCLSKNEDISECPVCSAPYPKHDFAFLKIIFPEKAANFEKMKICDCGKRVKISKIYCSNQDACEECIFKHFLRRKDKSCPKCRDFCMGLTFYEFQCSSCLRILNDYSSYLEMSISGVCMNFHILCCYCITLHRATSFCKICHSFVNLRERSISEIEQAQSTFLLGCLCGSNRGPTQKLSCCEHEVHSACLPSIYSCRLCNANIKDKPEPKSLKSYLAS